MFATIGPDDSDLRARLRAGWSGGSPVVGGGRAEGGFGARRAVLLDRDDTVCRCTGVAPGNDLGDPGLVELLPGAREACEALVRAGFVLVAVTNQGGVARGRYGIEAVRATCERVNELLGGLLSCAYFCPYHPSGTVARWTREHAWRKPGSGMVLAAGEDLGLDLGASWMVGDKSRDCVAGMSAGTRAVLVTGTVPGVASTDDGTLGQEVVRARDLGAAAAAILAQAGGAGSGR
ncbi:MAG: HAD-IIIA family hydrolase [Phycisphaerales bacterium]